MPQIDFSLVEPLEFSDRSGVIRSTWGCSLLGRSEFWQRIAAIAEQLQQFSEESPELSVIDLYRSDKWFKRNCDRCLELNGIDPDWLDGEGIMLTGLLLQHEDGPGLLIDLNRPYSAPDLMGKGDGSEAVEPNEWGVMASIWSATESLSEALTVAQSHPAKIVERVIAARNRQAIAEGKKQGTEGTTAKPTQNPKFQEWAAEQRRKSAENPTPVDFGRMREIEE